MKKSGLGRGLDALMSSLPDGPTGDQLLELALIEIDPNPNQPRRVFDEEALKELAASIKSSGVIQPILVRPMGNRYVIIAGERRWRASRLAGLTTIPAVVRDVERQKLYEMALIENLQREDLNPLEEARAIYGYMDQYGLTQEEAAEILGKSRSALANSLRLLQLPESVLELLATGSLTPGHARCLLALDDEESIKQLAARIVKDGLSVRQVEALTQEKRKTSKKHAQEEPEGFYVLTEAMRRAFGTRVKVMGTVDKGKIQIDYYSREDADRIYDVIASLDKE